MHKSYDSLGIDNKRKLRYLVHNILIIFRSMVYKVKDKNPYVPLGHKRVVVIGLPIKEK